uniref:Uncharacterized protein n=1 Tax=Knipowitschia caucasica TaxID=637954 RepID=A0AAV2MFX2_KNICA
MEKMRARKLVKSCARGWRVLCPQMCRGGFSSDLEQHLSSPQHSDAVAQSASSSSQSSHSLLERFLHDVLKHHPHSYGKSPCDLSKSKEQPPLGQREETPLAQTWASWQRARRGQQRGDFSSHHSSSTIEQVIRRYCYGEEDGSSSSSVHFSLPVSIETQTEWDLDLEEDRARAPRSLPEVRSLLEVQVDVEEDYSQQLQWLLEAPENRRGFLELPVESVLPLPRLILPSFRGKSWAQIEEEDEARVLKLVQQFKTGVRTCYFDSESLARYGQRGYDQTPALLPLCEPDEDLEPRKRRRKRRYNYSRAARCQVVKLSRGTQTLQVSSAVALVPETTPSQEPQSRTPATQASVPGASGPDPQFPDQYSSVLCPLQPHTSILYLLCSPRGHASNASDGSPSPRRRRRPTRHLRSKVTYRRLPLVQFTVKPAAKPRCVRQLFRNLNPEFNTGPAPKAAPPPPTPRRAGLRNRTPHT